MSELGRVVFVLGTSAGGTGAHVRMLAEGLVRRGVQTMVAGPRETEERYGFTGVGARFAEVPVADRPHPVNDLRTVAALRRITRGADLVHAHGLRAGALAGLGRPGGVPLVVTLHNALTTGGVIGVIYGVLERVVARRADLVLGVSPDLEERMVALGARRVGAAVVPAPDLRPAGRPAAEVRAELGAAGRPVVLTVGRLAQQKGLELLLDVAAGPWDGVEPLFVVAGEGPLRAALQERITRERLPVLLAGARRDIPDLLASADVVLWASRWEGQPLSLSEALKAGRPVVATAVGGIPGLLGGAGLLVPYGDAGAMRAAVLRALAEGKRLGRAAAARGRELPDDAAAVTAALRAYGEVLDV